MPSDVGVAAIRLPCTVPANARIVHYPLGKEATILGTGGARTTRLRSQRAPVVYWGEAVNTVDVPWHTRLGWRVRAFFCDTVRPPLGPPVYYFTLLAVAVTCFSVGSRCTDSRDGVPDSAPRTAEAAVTILEGRLLVDVGLTRDLGTLSSAVCGAASAGWPQFRLARFEPVSGVWIVPCEIHVMPPLGSGPTNYHLLFTVDSGDGTVERSTQQPTVDCKDDDGNYDDRYCR